MQPEFSMPPYISQEQLSRLQLNYAHDFFTILNADALESGVDGRFSSDLWQSGWSSWSVALYRLNSKFMRQLSEELTGDSRLCDRIKFAVNQWIDAVSPENFLATNPEAQKNLIESQGNSLLKGIKNFLSDLGHGFISQCDSKAFTVGKDLATTPGSVVFQNSFMQLIQYAPSTERVFSKPLLIIPPCINKFYILDLRPENSFVSYVVSQGYTVFLISWKNADEDLMVANWDDYLENGIIRAINVVRSISMQEKIHTLGFCIGGTLLSAAAGVLAYRKQNILESITLLTTLLDFSHPGVLGIFIDEGIIKYWESRIGEKGLLSGRELAQIFMSLRPRDLFWNYFVNNYLKGRDPPALDLLYWNNDFSNLSGPMYCWYLKHLYWRNELCVPNKLTCCGAPLDLSKITVPTFVYASRDDHIVPWTSAYRSVNLVSGPSHFVLGSSGHIAGVINPPSQNKRHYWEITTDKKGFSEDQVFSSPQDWFFRAKKYSGSWWKTWSRWLLSFGLEKKEAPVLPGNSDYPPIEKAPGGYVKTNNFYK